MSVLQGNWNGEWTWSLSPEKDTQMVWTTIEVRPVSDCIKVR